MTSTQQRAALQRQTWQIANDVRGSVDGWSLNSVCCVHCFMASLVTIPRTTLAVEIGGGSA